MTEAMLIWDTPLLFEKLFKEHDIKCQRIVSDSIGTPFIPPCKCVVIPTGFANKAYTKILPGIERNAKSLEKFVRSGGNLMVFGPMVPEYKYNWLPMELEYKQEQQVTTICMAQDHEAQCLVEDTCSEVEFDGYFSKTDGEVVFRSDEGKPLMVVKELGEGRIIATTIHEFPSGRFLKWINDTAKKSKL
ncbi:hypothetical protein [Methanolobus profundi]|uniref:Uncharacterized protein n=1 Tax=Methanolobus profundi TaxID=487685 RepID=A0A1I4QRT8_9EURY|nr:hypothetical protein [Methanolobus profundi]SFM42413.1 hypothetical protein SAMN04488696_1151 [Methanolobus profundi]